MPKNIKKFEYELRKMQKKTEEFENEYNSQKTAWLV